MDTSICLCYSKENGAYIDYAFEGNIPDNVIIRAYEKKGFVTKNVSIQDENIDIIIKSNFYYQRASYLFAEIRLNGNLLFDFDNSKLNVLVGASIAQHVVAAGDWDALFQKIMISINNKDNATTFQTAISYVQKLEKMFDNNSIKIKGRMHDIKTIKWEDAFLVLLYTNGKLHDLLMNIEKINIRDDSFTTCVLNCCRTFLSKLRVLDLDFQDKRVSQFSPTLLAVHKYIYQHGEENEFLKSYMRT